MPTKRLTSKDLRARLRLQAWLTTRISTISYHGERASLADLLTVTHALEAVTGVYALKADTENTKNVA